MPGPSDGSPWAPTGTQYEKTNATAIFALTAAISGYVCFGGIGGALAIVLGAIARAEIKRSDGRESGNGLATTAIVMGAFNVCLTVLGLAVGIAYMTRPHPKGLHASHASGPTKPPAWAPSPAPTRTGKAHKKGASERASRELGDQVTKLGAIVLADVSGDFEASLSTQRSAASAAGETLILWIAVPGCKPCDGVAAALTTPLAQKALARVRFVRVNRDEFRVELEQLGIPTEKIPGFALLDSRNRPLDFIHGGEWDADVAANIAPVLGKFAHGGYSRRRHPWHAAAPDDETAL